MRVVDAIVRFLEEYGVQKVFSVTGGGSAWLNDAFAASKTIDVVFTHHEQAAVMAAEGYARRAQVLGVAVVTLGPGATNAVTGVTAAWMDSVPLLILSGQSFAAQTVGDSGLRQLGIQETNIIPMIESVTKRSGTAKSAGDAIDKLVAFVHEAESGRPGPVWLEVPADVQLDQDAQTANAVDKNKAQVSTTEAATLVADTIRSSNRPLLHSGYGVRLSGAVDTFQAMIKRTKLPVVLSHNGADLLAHNHESNLGISGIFGNRTGNFAVQRTDCYLAIGTRLSLAQTGYNPLEYAHAAKRFTVDIDPTELSKKYLESFTRIEADAADFLSQLSEELANYEAPAEWRAELAELKARYPRVIPEARVNKAGFVNSYELMEQMGGLCSSFDTLVTDMGLAYQCAYQAFPLADGQRLITNTGHAPMGWGLPAAVGASLASGGGPVVCLTGDGGLMMNVQELSTLAYLRLPVLVVVYNNGGYLTLRQTQQLGFGSRFTGVDADSGIGFPNFVELANAHGVDSSAVNSVELALEKIREWSIEPRPFLLDVSMDIEQVQGPKIISRKDESGRPIQGRLEDMWPFLDVSEIDSVLRR